MILTLWIQGVRSLMIMNIGYFSGNWDQRGRFNKREESKTSKNRTSLEATSRQRLQWDSMVAGLITHSMWNNQVVKRRIRKVNRPDSDSKISNGNGRILWLLEPGTLPMLIEEMKKYKGLNWFWDVLHMSEKQVPKRLMEASGRYEETQ